jgi:hypothetical protein
VEIDFVDKNAHLAARSMREMVAEAKTKRAELQHPLAVIPG